MIFRVTHVNLHMSAGGEKEARAFYGDLLQFQEVQKPEALRQRGGLWFELAHMDLHLTVGEEGAADVTRHIGIEATDLEGLRKAIEEKGHPTEDGGPVPWRRFIAKDPFGNRLEFHEPGGPRRVSAR